MANPNLQKIIKLTQSQYNTLANGGTVGDYTGLNDNYLYLIQEDYEFPTTTTARKILMSTSTAGLVSWQSLTANDIPLLDASKINSGIFNASRIPNLNASKINAGTFDITRIPTGTTASTVALGNHTHTAANIVSWLGLGTTRSASAMTWGTLTTANGYTILLATDQPNGGGWVIAEKDGKTYMQIDGDFYVNEGGTRLARVGEAQPASDVYAWAKASSKPGYNYSEISAGNITLGSGSNYINLRSGHNSYNGVIYYSTPGNEAVVFSNKNAVTSWIFEAGLDGTNSVPSWQTFTGASGSNPRPSLQIKNGHVAINKLIPNDATGDYNLDVNGTLNATTIYQNGTTLDNTYLAKNAQAKDSAKLNGEEASYYLNYNNLNNKPTIPTVSNATITIKQTGISDQTFTLNGSAVTITLVDTNTWRPLGTGANDACAGNDSRLSDARPASDVYAWAKASTKPSYTYSEVGAAASNHNHDGVYLKLSGGTLTGHLKWNDSSALPSATNLGVTAEYILCIKAFVDGGDTFYETKSNFLSGYATTTWVGNNYLGKNATAADSSKLNGQAASYYLNYNNLSNTPSSLPASDVYDWAKATTKPSYTASEVGALASDAKVVLYTSQSLTTLQKSTARSNIGAGTSSLALGNTATTAAAGNHNHDSVYLKLTGGTITGGLSVTQGISVGGGIIPYFPQSTTNFLYGYGGCYTQNVHQQVDVIGDIIALYTSDESRDYSTVLAVHNEGYGIALKAHFAYTSNYQAAVYDRDSFNAAVLTIYAEDLLIYPNSVNSSLTNKFVRIGVVEHNVKITYSTTFYVRLNFRGDNSVETAATSTSTLAAKLYSAGHRSAATALCCSGRYTNYQYCVTAIYALSTTTLRVVYLGTTNITESEYNIPSSATVTDVLTYKLVA